MKTIPSNAQISSMMEGAYFANCFVVLIQNDGQSAMHVWLEMIKKPPQWINAFMFIRNKIAPLFGWKDIDFIREVILIKQVQDYIKGDKVGVFTLFHSQKNEVILEDKDDHLTVKISLFLEPVDGSLKVSLSTVVHVHSRLGKVYTRLVVPIQKMLVSSVLAKLKKA